MSQSEDQWSTSNLGEGSSISNELNANSGGGKLQAILGSDFETSLSKAKSVSSLLEAEIQEWEAQFPNLLIQGSSIKAEEQQPNYIQEQITTQRLSVARRLVLTTIFPEIQKLFRDELGLHLTIPKSTKSRSKSSKTITDKTETKLTLPVIQNLKK
uniref:Uncharacterized protein n=1 Tax=Panagrolaimus sp. PS1159 TaxID=55785 RepID=A0AC35F9B9_9BILA